MNRDADAPADPEQVRVRRDKLVRLRAEGADPFLTSSPRTSLIGPIRAKYDELGPDEHTGVHVGIAGRVLLARNSGKLAFASVRDSSGEIQLMLALDRLGSEVLDAWKNDVDLGDQVGVEGEVITSRKGELSVLVERWWLLGKCLRPLPDKHEGLADPEARVRQRYLDLIVTPEAREMATQRPRVLRALRDGLHEAEFTEVETPMLQPIHGGATARPFTTHINAYDMRLYLRIAPELYLKRLVVGGMEQVFEINRNFRNEGADRNHNPEFTMLEFYQAHADYRDGAALTQQLLQRVASILGIDEENPLVSGDWPWEPFYGLVSQALNADVGPHTPLDALTQLAAQRGVTADPDWGPGKLAEHIFEELVEPQLVEPTFVCDFPTETSPLTRQHPDEPLLAQKWDLIGFGMELGTGFSELTDPDEQRRRLTEQARLAAGGDAEAMELDEDFLTALEYAMPPTAGVGVGIDRLLMALTGSNIRETILFPLVKPN